MPIFDTDKNSIIKLMLSRSTQYGVHILKIALGPELLKVENIGVTAKVKDISFTVKASKVI
ncbi:MAG: hypothetical protein ABI045_03970 [Flavobacteriales bacterium]